MTPFATGIDKISIITHKNFKDTVTFFESLGIFVLSHPVIEASEPVAYVPSYFSARNYTDVYQFKINKHSYIHILKHKDSEYTDISFSGLSQYKTDLTPIDTLPQTLNVLKSLISAEFYPVLKAFDIAFDFQTEYSSFVATNIDTSKMIDYKTTLYSHKRNDRGQLPTNTLCVYNKTDKNKLSSNLTRVEFRKRLQKSSRVLIQGISDLETFIRKQEKKVRSLIALYFYNSNTINTSLNSINFIHSNQPPNTYPTIPHTHTQSIHTHSVTLLNPKILAITEHPQSQILELTLTTCSVYLINNTLHFPPSAMEVVKELIKPIDIRQIIKDTTQRN